MAVSAGTASLQVVPQLAKQFSRDLMQQMVGPANRAADKTGHQAGQRLSRQFDRAGDDSARRYGVRFNKRLGAGFSASTKIASVAAGAIGGAFAAVQIGGFLKGAIEEAREAAKVGRQTAAVIKATGGVAKVSAGDVNKLADRLSALAGVDDEVIATGANMLLTFKNVRNEVGKGNDIFDQASVAALDMTAAMGKGVVTQEGLQASTIRLGKALNDPLKGMTALTKVGVTFTEGQRDQIKALVEAGDTMGAQQIILKELATEFGGAAKAAADPWQRVTVALGNVKESIGTVLLPALNRAADFIVSSLIPAVQKWWKLHGPKIRESFVKLAEVLEEVWVRIRDDLLPAFQEVASFVSKDLQPTIDDLTQTWKDNKDAIGGLKQTNNVSLDTWKKVAAFLADVMAKQVERLTTVVGVLARVWTAASRGVNVATTKMVVTFVEAFRTIVRAAATVAEKLHLPFAKGLRAAEKEMGGWVKNFNRNLDRLNDEGVNIKLRSTFTPPKGFSMHSIVGAQEGMRIPGYGGGDRIPIMAEAGEAVVPKHLAATSGFRDWAGGHGIPGFQRGGVIPDLQPFSPAGARGTQRGIDRQVASRTAAGIGRNFKLLVAGAGIQRALSWARGEQGKPYVWGGVGPGGYDCCMRSETLVYGPTGPKRIDELQPGHLVWSYEDGKMTAHPVIAAWQSRTQPTFKVRTRNRVAVGSANHPFMRLVPTTERHRIMDDVPWPGPLTGSKVGVGECSVGTCSGPVWAKGMCNMHDRRHRTHGDPRIHYTTRTMYQVQWARLDELQRGDLLVQSKKMTSPDHVNQHPTLPDGTPVTTDVAWLLGLAVGDGSVTPKGLMLSVFGAERQRAAQVCLETWGRPACLYEDHKRGVRFHSVQLARALAQMGMRHPAHDKRVPADVWTWDETLQQAFLDGYCDADGHRPANQKKYGERTYHSVSWNLISEIRALHMTLGHPVSNIRTLQPPATLPTINGVQVKSMRVAYQFAVVAGEGRGEVVLRRHPEIAAWLDNSDFTLSPVLAITDEGVQDTYDIEVEGAHNFIGDGIQLHNSGFMSAIANVVAGRSPHHRLFATGSFPTAGWAPGYSPVGFSIGSRRGDPGHMAGTLGGVNVESRGSMGVVVGAAARGARSGLFGGNIWHLAGRSGSAGGEESLRVPRGRAFDRGGWLMPGTTIAQNNTGRPERVLPPGSGGGAITINVNVPPTAHPAEVGREVVHAIRQYEQRSGTSWRR